VGIDDTRCRCSLYLLGNRLECWYRGSVATNATQSTYLTSTNKNITILMSNSSSILSPPPTNTSSILMILPLINKSMCPGSCIIQTSIFWTTSWWAVLVLIFVPEKIENRNKSIYRISNAGETKESGAPFTSFREDLGSWPMMIVEVFNYYDWYNGWLLAMTTGEDDDEILLPIAFRMLLEADLGISWYKIPRVTFSA